MARGRGLCVAGLIVCVGTSVAATQDAAPTGATSTADHAPGETSFLVENLTRAEIWHFFEIYEALEPDKSLTPGRGWERRKEAAQAVEDARRRYAEQLRATAD